MKAISLQQPWASLVVMGHKKIETRSWNTKHRGELLIHASGKMTKEQKRLVQKFNRDFELGLGFIGELPTGAIIGKVNLVNTFGIYYQKWGSKFSEKEKAFGDYSFGRYGWLLSDPVQFKIPIPAKGSLSIWEYPHEIADFI